MSDPAKEFNLLFGVFAIQLRKINATELAEVAAAWATDPSRSLAARLVEKGVLTIADCDLIENLIGQAVEEKDGDIQATLAEVSGLPNDASKLNETIFSVMGDGATVPGKGSGSGIRDLAQLIHSTGVEESDGRYIRQSMHAHGGMG